jgi:hypothetical protein
VSPLQQPSPISRTQARALFAIEKRQRRTAVAAVLDAIQNDPFSLWAALAAVNQVYDGYPAMFRALANLSAPVPPLSAQCWLSIWCMRGCYLRTIGGDQPTIVQAMRRILPPYSGRKRRVYRGESASNYRRHRLGISWTVDPTVARQFAQSPAFLASDGGSVVLAANAPRRAILARVFDSHYAVEREVLIDPSKLRKVRRIESFAQIPTQGRR